MDPDRKRGWLEAAVNGNDGLVGSKRFRETDAQPGLGSKLKPCTKFFSTTGCPFGDGCHFLHYVPGGINVLPQMMRQGNSTHPPLANPMAPRGFPDGLSASAVKARLCNKYNTAEGCKFGSKCYFAHGERELGRPVVPSHDEHHMAPPPIPPSGSFGRHVPPSSDVGATASFGAKATAKLSVDASLAGVIIGKGGMNSKLICRETGAKLSIRENELDPNTRNIELEGTFEQIKHASAMVQELILNISASASVPARNPTGSGAPFGPGSNFKRKLCENFAKGSCTFGDCCRFAHGAGELR